MIRDPEKLPKLVHTPESVAEQNTQTKILGLQQAIIQAILFHTKMDEQQSHQVEELLVTPELTVLSDVWWLVSFEAVRVIVENQEINLISCCDDKALDIRLTKAQQSELKRGLHDNQPIARYGLLNVYVRVHEPTGSLTMEVREERWLSKMPVAPSVKLILDAARPVIEAAHYGDDIRDAVVHPDTGVVTYFYANRTEWHVSPNDRDYSLHRRIAQGETVKIGVELSTRVMYKFPGQFIDSNTGRRIDPATIHTTSLEIDDLLELIPTVKYCRYSGDDEREKIAGELHLELYSGDEMVISSSTSPHQYNYLVRYFLDKSTIEVGRIFDGNNLYFSAKSGLIMGNLERNLIRLPELLKKTPLFNRITVGNYYTHQPKDNRISTYLAGKEYFISAQDPVYETVVRFCQGHTGIIPYRTETSLGEETIRVYVIFQDRSGIWVDDYPATVIDGKISVHWPNNEKPKQAFRVPSSVVGKAFENELLFDEEKSSPLRQNRTGENQLSATKLHHDTVNVRSRGGKQPTPEQQLRKQRNRKSREQSRRELRNASERHW